MRKSFGAAVLSVLITAAISGAQPKLVFIEPIVNEVSLYHNFLDDGSRAGQTLQIVSINGIDLLTGFQVEFTADFNRKMTPGKDSDYYLEIGIVKPVISRFALNYQRIHGTFIANPINQIGVRYSF